MKSIKIVWHFLQHFYMKMSIFLKNQRFCYDFIDLSRFKCCMWCIRPDVLILLSLRCDHFTVELSPSALNSTNYRRTEKNSIVFLTAFSSIFFIMILFRSLYLHIFLGSDNYFSLLARTFNSFRRRKKNCKRSMNK